MMIISVNTKDKTITMTSIMRDCYATFEDLNTPGWWWSDRINAAYWYGGVELTKSTIENYMNVKIDRYVLVNFNVFIDIVDALGGIEMDVTDDEANGYPDADPYGDNTRGMQNPLDEQNKYLHNKKGTDYLPSGGHYNLNGNQALAYARLRYVGNADFERTERQREVIGKIIDKVKGSNPLVMNRFAKTTLSKLSTNMSRADMMLTAYKAVFSLNYTVRSLRIPEEGVYSFGWHGDQSTLDVDLDACRTLLRQELYG
jgi:LCP family protein required for cell wall assembly